jgi:1,4-alpha-glucan branching enzyme
MKSLVHLIEVDGVKGVYFAVWPLLVPYLSWVTLILDRREHQLEVRWDSSGIWEGLFQILKRGNL